MSRLHILIYAACAFLSTALFLNWAQTESPHNQYSSVVALRSGDVPAPFVRRRLMVDVAAALADAVPQPVWRAAWRSVPRAALQRRLGWTETHFPILASASLVIASGAWLAMWAGRELALAIYDASPQTATMVGLAMGAALLGAYGNDGYQWMPYDWPHAGLLALAYLLIVERRTLALLLVTALASYSKETALLIPAAYLLWHGRGALSRRHVLVAVALVCVVCAIQAWLWTTYPPEADGRWWHLPGNLKWMAWQLAFNSWMVAVSLLLALRVRQLWARFPSPFRRWVWLAILLLVPTMFKGQLNEIRMYLEVAPVFVLLGVQWAAIEAGRSELMNPRVGTSTATSGALA